MAKKPKHRYDVYRQYYQDTEDPERSFTEPWEYVGTTMAVSENQAINNVRWHKFSEIPRYRPLATGGHWETGYNWKAEVV